MANTFYDTDTELVWLDTRMTGWNIYSSNLPFNHSNRTSFTIDQNLSNFSDFRIATESEVRTLIANTFTSLTFNSDGNYSYSDSWSRSTGGDHSVQDPNFTGDWNNFTSAADGLTYSTYQRSSDGLYGTSRIDGLFLNGNGEYGYLSIETNYGYKNIRNLRWVLASEYVTSSIYYKGPTNSLTKTSTRLWMVYNPAVTSVPEPSTLAIFALGIIGLVSRRFKKQ